MFVAMKLSRSQQQYLLIGHCIVPFVINFILNRAFPPGLRASNALCALAPLSSA